MKTDNDKASCLILSVIGYAMIFGGLVRIFATRNLFELFGIGSLWSEHEYFQYIYSILGGFVLLTGIAFNIMARNISRYKRLMMAWALAFFILGLIMLVSGIINKIPAFYFLPDLTFSLLVSFLLIMISAKKAH